MDYVKFNADKPLLYFSGGRFVAEENWCHSKRRIDSFVLIVGVSGSVYIQQEEEHYVVTPGSVLLLMPNVTHKGYKASENGASYYWCHFKCQSDYTILRQRDMNKELFGLNGKCDNYSDILLPLFCKLENVDRLYILFRQLVHAEIFNQHVSSQVNYLLTSLTMEITEQVIRNQSIDYNKNGKSRFNEVLEWIRINLNKNLSVNEIAERFYYNPNYLSRIFKQRMNTNLLSYITSLKMERAKYLLVNSDETIKEIAYGLGFGDEKHFMKIFKRYVLLTPTQYRNAFFNTHLNSH